jgi:hypothetical protein
MGKSRKEQQTWKLSSARVLASSPPLREPPFAYVIPTCPVTKSKGVFRHGLESALQKPPRLLINHQHQQQFESRTYISDDISATPVRIHKRKWQPCIPSPGRWRNLLDLFNDVQHIVVYARTTHPCKDEEKYKKVIKRCTASTRHR